MANLLFGSISQKFNNIGHRTFYTVSAPQIPKRGKFWHNQQQSYSIIKVNAENKFILIFPSNMEKCLDYASNCVNNYKFHFLLHFKPPSTALPIQFLQFNFSKIDAVANWALKCMKGRENQYLEIHKYIKDTRMLNARS